MKLIFRVLNTELKGLTYSTDNDIVDIGRSSDNDLTLKQRSISRHHAVIRQDEEGVVELEDLGSKNTTEINGQTCQGLTELASGTMLQFGDVKVHLSIPELEAPVPHKNNEDEVTPEGAVMDTITEQDSSGQISDTDSTGEDINNGKERGIKAYSNENQQRPPSIEGFKPREDSPGKIKLSENESTFWTVMSGVLGIIIAVIIAVYFIKHTGAGDAPLREMGTSLRVGEVKIVEVPSGFVHNPIISPSDMVEIERTLTLNMAVTIEARSQGMARAELYNPAGDRILLHIHILPREREPSRDLQPVPREERAETAREKMLLAESLRINGRLYEARKLYKEVTEMLRTMGGSSSFLLRNAESKRSQLAREIDNKHEEMRFRTSALVKMGRRRDALNQLEDIMELIPDENDVRHQNAQMLHRMLLSIIERENR